MADMFSKTFTCTVTTDAEGNFHSSTPVEGSHLFAVKVNVQATLQSPAETSLTGMFAIAPGEARPFTGVTHETVELGKWQVAKGVNTATATGSTNPRRPNTELVVRFDASL